jgi:hypothetical protein
MLSYVDNTGALADGFDQAIATYSFRCCFCDVFTSFAWPDELADLLDKRFRDVDVYTHCALRQPTRRVL